MTCKDVACCGRLRPSSLLATSAALGFLRPTNCRARSFCSRRASGCCRGRRERPRLCDRFLLPISSLPGVSDSPISERVEGRTDLKTLPVFSQGQAVWHSGRHVTPPGNPLSRIGVSSWRGCELRNRIPARQRSIRDRSRRMAACDVRTSIAMVQAAPEFGGSGASW